MLMRFWEREGMGAKGWGTTPVNLHTQFSGTDPPGKEWEDNGNREGYGGLMFGRVGEKLVGYVTN